MKDRDLGKIEARLDEHSHQIEHLNQCVEQKRRRLDGLKIVNEIVQINVMNLEKRIDDKEKKDEKRHQEFLHIFNKAIGELSTKFNKVEKLLNRIMWSVLGATSVITFIFIMLEKIPAIILNIQKFL